MMAERRVVVLREVEALKRKPKVRAALLEYLGRPAPDTVLVLVQGAGEETEDKEIARPRSRWRSSRCRPTGCSSGSSAGPRGWASSCRTTRRATWCAPSAASSARSRRSWRSSRRFPPGEPLTVERVGELVGVRHGETVFDWRDAVLDGPARARASACSARCSTSRATPASSW